MNSFNSRSSLVLSMTINDIISLENNNFFYVNYLDGRTFITGDVFFPINFNEIAGRIGQDLMYNDNAIPFIKYVFRLGNMYFHNLRCLMENPDIYIEDTYQQLQRELEHWSKDINVIKGLLNSGIIPELECFAELSLMYLGAVADFTYAYNSYNNKIEINGNHRVNSIINAIDRLNINNLVTSNEKEAKDISERMLKSENIDTSIFLIP